MLLVTCFHAQAKSDTEWRLEFVGEWMVYAPGDYRAKGYYTFTVPADGVLSVESVAHVSTPEWLTPKARIVSYSSNWQTRRIKLKGDLKNGTLTCHEDWVDENAELVLEEHYPPGSGLGVQTTKREVPVGLWKHTFEVPLVDGGTYDWTSPGGFKFRYTVHSAVTLPPLAIDPRIANAKQAIKKCQVTSDLMDQAAQGNGGKEPEIAFDEHGKTTGDVIFLNKARTGWRLNYQLILELSNVALKKQFRSIYDRADKGDLSQEQYVEQIERLEFIGQRLRWRALSECGADWGWAGDGVPDWEKDSDFDKYYKQLKEQAPTHWQRYADDWTQEYKGKYLAKHPSR